MKIVVVGVGHCGTKIADVFSSSGYSALAINTARQDLSWLNFIPSENRVLIGKSITRGRGVGANPLKGRDAANSDIQDVYKKIKEIGSQDIDIYFVSAGLGGGTGSGGAPIIAQKIKEEFPESLVVGIGVLPLAIEGDQAIINSAIGLSGMNKAVDALILIDNERLRSADEDISTAYENINRAIVSRINTLVRFTTMSGEQIIDGNDVKATLSGFGGIATIGYVNEPVKSVNSITPLIEKAIKPDEGLYLDIDVKTALKAIVAISGPMKCLAASEIFEGLEFLKETIKGHQVFRGIYPKPNADQVEILALLSGVYRSPRIDEIMMYAKNAAADLKAAVIEAEKSLYDLLRDGEELESFYT
ncbi:MAG: cell division protein FtsZ [Candidatus Hydrothermarchaeota archaeon]